jgi:hypothetical protein
MPGLYLQLYFDDDRVKLSRSAVERSIELSELHKGRGPLSLAMLQYSTHSPRKPHPAYRLLTPDPLNWTGKPESETIHPISIHNLTPRPMQME